MEFPSARAPALPKLGGAPFFGTGRFPYHLVPFEFSVWSLLIIGTSLNYCDLSPAMSKSEHHYRGLAEECRRNARDAHDPGERDTLLRIGALYDDLADRKARKQSEQT
jgi:hypothetical protein